jgi:hypothetical protein
MPTIQYNSRSNEQTTLENKERKKKRLFRKNADYGRYIGHNIDIKGKLATFRGWYLVHYTVTPV